MPAEQLVASSEHPGIAGLSILDRNLLMLSLRSPRAAELVRQAAPSPLELVQTPSGHLGGGFVDGLASGAGVAPASASTLPDLGADFGASFAAELGESLTGVEVKPTPRHQLASRVDPIREAKVLADSVDATSVAAVVVMGFGLGYHVREFAERLRETGVVIVYEPDVGLLRAVLERVDCSAWLARANTFVLTDAADHAAIAGVASGRETLLALGTRVVTHPGSAARLSAASQPAERTADAFAQAFARVFAAVRTHVVTTLVQVQATLRNLLQNTDHYVTVPGVADLKDRCRGKPAVIVAAGPSLARNLELLAKPGVRDRVVIIAVQTVLRHLLARGIRPHFVTALDHHEISRRFYEGLTPADVEGVTLIAEPKANPAILEAFPGVIRCPGDAVLDRVLSESRDLGEVPPGATVAHLAYYVARHLGCNPAIFIGQDLGFTDGQYYAAGAAIHEVWSGELSEFNTLEMLEWQRIARMKSLLRRATDQLGRPIYTDEQMSTYLVQFERDFKADAERGLTTIDSTEGGVRKAHTEVLPLGAALERHAQQPLGVAPDPIHDDAKARASRGRLPRSRQEKALERLRRLRVDTGRFVELSTRTRALLERMLSRHDDQPEVNRLIEQVYALRDQVVKLTDAGWLVHYLNQNGTFRRFREDRAIEMDAGLKPMERQRRQIQRDIDNVRWLADAGTHCLTMLDEAIASLLGQPKVTRDFGEEEAAEQRAASSTGKAGSKRVGLVVIADHEVSALGLSRDLSRPLANGKNALELTLTRALKAKGPDEVVVLCVNEGKARSLAGDVGRDRRVSFVVVDPVALRDHARAVGAARLWSRACWRGGVANLSIGDEVCCPPVLLAILESRELDAAALIGGDWALVDPGLIDATITRYREAPSRHHLVFSQAAPGLCPVLIDRVLTGELSKVNGPQATLGALLGYIPIAPQGDPIAKGACIPIDTIVRDAHARLIADCPAGEKLVRELGDRPADAAEVASLARALGADAFPEIVHLHLADGNGREMPAATIARLAEQLGQRRDVAVTLHAGSATRSTLRGAILALRERGVVAIHVRTPSADDSLLDLAPSVVSVDGDAGLDGLAAWRDRALAATRLPTPWIVPRLTRRDSAYERIETWYDLMLMRFGAACLDPLPAPRAGERIAPLPLPSKARERFERTTLVIDAGGRASSCLGTPLGDAGATPIATLWAGNRPGPVEPPR